jgi:hypothetical protein
MAWHLLSEFLEREQREFGRRSQGVLTLVPGTRLAHALGDAG